LFPNSSFFILYFLGVRRLLLFLVVTPLDIIIPVKIGAKVALCATGWVMAFLLFAPVGLVVLGADTIYKIKHGSVPPDDP
jgi:hypothetical protein